MRVLSPVAQCVVVKCPPPAALQANKDSTHSDTQVQNIVQYVLSSLTLIAKDLRIARRSFRTCLCSLERKTKVDSCLALRCSPLPIEVRWPFLEQYHNWLLASVAELVSLPAREMQGLRRTPSYCSPGAVRHSRVCSLRRARCSGSQSHS